MNLLSAVGTEPQSTVSLVGAFALFVLGACVGGLMNLAIYRLAYRPRSISPWSAPPAKGPPRSWTDRIPILGWWGLRRESRVHGGAVWLRPMLVEICSGVFCVALYWWETIVGGLLPPLKMPNVPAAAAMAAADHELILRVQFAVHCLLVALLIVAALIDVDEMTIPDTITVPGTLLALMVAAIYPWSLLPAAVWNVPPKIFIGFLTLASPHDWPAALGAAPAGRSLALALACWWLWCVALMPRRWHGRYGLARAMQLFLERLRREPSTWRLIGLGLTGSAAISLFWWQGNEASWAGLLTSLVGLAVGGGLVWLVRVIGSAALGREAMGFGDVTLMAMIGAFLGWQASLAIFFLAPFAGLVVGGLQWILRRQREMPYGPFLCLATLVVLVRWSTFWSSMQETFTVGWLVPAVLLVCLALLGLLLILWRLVLALFAGRSA